MKPKILILLFSGLLSLISAQAQSPKLHAHNDYLHERPFYMAYENGFHSIEVDVLLIDDQLYVAHEKATVQKDRTIESLYFQPIAKLAQKGKPTNFQLLVDMKTEAYTSLNKLIDILNNYPALTANDAQLKIVISGNRPKPQDYGNFPDYIFFDYQDTDLEVDLDWDKVAMISYSFWKHSKWKGEEPMETSDQKHLTTLIEAAHKKNKPIRFWATPDTPLAWETLHDLEVDFINTDKIEECKLFFK